MLRWLQGTIHDEILLTNNLYTILRLKDKDHFPLKGNFDIYTNTIGQNLIILQCLK